VEKNSDQCGLGLMGLTVPELIVSMLKEEGIPGGI